MSTKSFFVDEKNTWNITIVCPPLTLKLSRLPPLVNKILNETLNIYAINFDKCDTPDFQP